MSERYVLLGVAFSRSAWFGEVARWCTNGSIPAQFLKCVSAQEARARLSSGRPHSALLIDHRDGTVDRDLVADARAKGCVVVVIADPHVSIDLTELGIAARLDPDFTRAALLDVLAAHTSLITDTTVLPGDPDVLPAQPTPWSGRLIGVCGPGGTGTSTVATAVAQALAADPRNAGLVLLADLALDADLAMLHGTSDVVPGLPELVDACRRGAPSPTELQRLTFAVPTRRYRLLLGLRRHRDWAALRPASVAAAIDGLTRSFQYVIADIDGDVEGDRQCGVLEIEDRNVLARTAVGNADLVVAVGGPGLKGMHGLARLVDALIDVDVDPSRIVPVINRAPRRVSRRAETTRAFAALAPRLGTPPIYLPERHGVDDLFRDGAALPGSFTDPLRSAIDLVFGRAVDLRHDSEPQRVRPGELGAWSDQDAAAR